MSASVQDRPSAGRSPAPETCQMFETPLIERFSRIDPASPFVFWLPVLAYAGYRALVAGVALPPFAGLVVLGVLLWSFTEYTLHRWVFHYRGPVRGSGACFSCCTASTTTFPRTPTAW